MNREENMGWNDYTKWEEDREDWLHELWLNDQKVKEEKKTGEMIKNAGLYEIASGDGRAQLSFFPPVEKKNKKDAKEQDESKDDENKQNDEDENGM